MSTNKSRFLKLVSPHKSDVLEKHKWRIENRDSIRLIQAIELYMLIENDKKNKNN